MLKVLLISGHGAGDNGACATIDGKTYKESKETVDMVKRIKNQLNKYRNVKVKLYPTGRNAFEDVKNGKLKVDFRDYDYILEVHFNACVKDYKGNGNTTGTEIYVNKTDSSIDTEEKIVKYISDLGFKNRGVKRSSFTVIYYAYKKASVESSLLELCFIDDADDMKIYLANKPKIAKAIAKGIAKSYNLKLKSDNELSINDKVIVKKGARDLNTGKKYSDFVYGTVYTVIRVDKGDKVAFGLNGMTVGYTNKSNLTKV